mgnify:CR=1 FL=1|jgi:hypothetical protein
MTRDGMRVCSRKCIELKTGCPNEECRLWIDYKNEYNCTLIAIYENGSMTLREIAERSGISFARVKQIETRAVGKIKNAKTLSCFEF